MQRLLHGDCITELRKLHDRSVDLLLTDPPYGDATGYGRGNRTIANNSSPLIGLLALAETFRIQRLNTNAYFFLDVKHLPIVERFVCQYTDYRIKDWLVWDKIHMGMGHGFRKRHELILVLEKGKPKYRNLGFANVVPCQRINTDDHPHKKPMELLVKLIQQSTDAGATVLDPFMGSGSTAVATKSCGRQFVGIECELKYVETARRRLCEGN